MKSHVHLLLLHEVQYITILSGTLKLAVKRWIEGLLSVDMGGGFLSLCTFFYSILNYEIAALHSQ